MPHGFMSVNTKMGAGRAFLRSLFQQYVEWGVDFGTFYTSIKWKVSFSSTPSLNVKLWMFGVAYP